MHQRARLAASRMPKLEIEVRDARAAALRNRIRIKPITPKAPTCGSFIISSLRAGDTLANKPSQQSARPSRCNPPVNRIQTASVMTPAIKGENTKIAPFQASHVNAPMTRPTSGYHTAARPLSPTDQSSGSLNGSVVIKPKAIRKFLRSKPLTRRAQRTQRLVRQRNPMTLSRASVVNLVTFVCKRFIPYHSHLLHRKLPSHTKFVRTLQ